MQLQPISDAWITNAVTATRISGRMAAFQQEGRSQTHFPQILNWQDDKDEVVDGFGGGCEDVMFVFLSKHRKNRLHSFGV